MLSVTVKIGRDPPLNGSSCCESLFSPVPFLTDQVVFLKSNHPTSTYLEYELIIAQGVCFRAQPSFPVSTGGLTIVTQHDNLLYAKKCCYGNIQMNQQITTFDLFSFGTNLCNHKNERSAQVWPCHCESRHCWCKGNIMMFKLLTLTLTTRAMLKLSLSTNFWHALTSRASPSLWPTQL